MARTAAIAPTAGDRIDPRHGPIPGSASIDPMLDGSELVRLGHTGTPGDSYTSTAAIAALAGYRRLFTTPALMSLAANTAEQTFVSLLLPSLQLAANGQLVRLRAFGGFSLNAQTRNIRGYFGSSIVAVGHQATSSTPAWRFELEVLRIGANAQLYSAQFICGTPNILASGSQWLGGSGSEDLTAPVAMTLTAQSDALGANDIFCNYATFEYVP